MSKGQFCKDSVVQLTKMSKGQFCKDSVVKLTKMSKGQFCKDSVVKLTKMSKGQFCKDSVVKLTKTVHFSSLPSRKHAREKWQSNLGLPISNRTPGLLGQRGGSFKGQHVLRWGQAHAHVMIHLKI